MTSIRSFRDLDAYKVSYRLALQIYKATRSFPESEKHGLTDQLRRAAVSIPSNIAEGYRRYSRTDYLRFLRIAFGSCGELETQLDLCHDLDFLNGEDHAKLAALNTDVSKILYGLISALKQ